LLCLSEKNSPKQQAGALSKPSDWSKHAYFLHPLSVCSFLLRRCELTRPRSRHSGLLRSSNNKCKKFCANVAEGTGHVRYHCELPFSAHAASFDTRLVTIVVQHSLRRFMAVKYHNILATSWAALPIDRPASCQIPSSAACICQLDCLRES